MRHSLKNESEHNRAYSYSMKCGFFFNLAKNWGVTDFVSEKKAREKSVENHKNRVKASVHRNIGVGFLAELRARGAP